MRLEDIIPPSHKPLPPILSETGENYRWPAIQTKEPPFWPTDRVPVEGPHQSHAPQPRLRYHRQSTYTDVFKEEKPFYMRGYSVESDWLDKIGESGDFYGVTTYVKDYEWPEGDARMPIIPIKSTMGFGILPLVGKKGDHKGIYAGNDKDKDADKKMNGDVDRTDGDCLHKRKYIRKDVVPLQDLFLGETTHRSDFLNPIKAHRSQKAKPPEPELKFSGKIEMSTSTMRDFRDPKYVKHEDYFPKKLKECKDEMESRFPYFLF